jgi:hypothetical protein
LMSQDDLFAKSRQALLGTDGAASQPANPKAKPMPTNTAVSPQATDGGASQTANPRAEPMPTDRSAGASDRWAAAWVTRAIAAEWSRLRPFQFQSLLQTADTREVSHTGTWAHFVNKLERCVAAHTRQELGVANVEHSRRFSACDALQTATTAVVSLLYKLQFRSPELIDEFKSLVERLVVNTSRFVAADVVLQRLLSSGFTSSDEQRRKQIVSAIAAEMENTFSCRKTTRNLMREVGHRGLPPSSEASATTGGAWKTADTARHLLPRPPTTPPPGHLLDNSARPARA